MFSRSASAVLRPVVQRVAAPAAARHVSSLSSLFFSQRSHQALSNVQHRTFHNTRVAAVAQPTTPVQAPAAAAVAVTTDSDAPYPETAVVHGENAGIIEKYGMYPLVGLGLAACVSKELLLLNEEFVLVFTFGSFCAVSYMFGWETIGKSLDKQCDDIRSGIVAGYEEKEAVLEETITNINKLFTLKDDVDAMQADYNFRREKLDTYYTRKYKADLYEDVDKAMSELHTRNLKFKRDMRNQLADGAFSFATTEFAKSPQAAKDLAIEAAIANVSYLTKSAPEAERKTDSVEQLFNTYLSAQKPGSMPGEKEFETSQAARADELYTQVQNKYKGAKKVLEEDAVSRAAARTSFESEMQNMVSTPAPANWPKSFKDQPVAESSR